MSINYFQFAPFVLTPSLYPRKEFEKAVNLQTILNELIHNVAHDTEFLRETLAGTIQVDEFTSSLFKIYETVLSEGVTQVRFLKYIVLLFFIIFFMIFALFFDDPSFFFF